MNIFAFLDNEEIYGDFEDLETGELHEGGDGGESMDESDESGKEGENKGGSGGAGQEKTKAELRSEKKKKLKEMFNADYDDGKGRYLFPFLQSIPVW